MTENSVKEIFVQIETENLVLRNINMSDKAFVYEQFSDSEVCRFLLDAEPFTSMKEAEKLIEWYIKPEPRGQHRWIIVRKADGASLGTCGYHNWNVNDRCCDIGYDLNNRCWGKGYMTEALQGILKFGFENMRLNRIQAFVYPQNIKSVNLLLRLGFTREGIIRDKHFFRGNYYDHYCFSLLKREWQLRL
jgi:ribosomal-protein-alanine N-acetyltransferase